jgi:hypothetical protein
MIVQRYPQLSLRLGLAAVFLIFGLDKFTSEEAQFASWADWVPGWFSMLIGGQIKGFISDVQSRSALDDDRRRRRETHLKAT